MSDKLFGEIPGIKIGDVFENRAALSEAGIHRPSMAGIWGSQETGAYSIVLSGGYEDDIDQLDYILYTGQGGQDAQGGQQVKDQEFTRGNKALAINMEEHLPVRVNRGYQVSMVQSLATGMMEFIMLRISTNKEESRDSLFIDLS